MTQNKKKGFLEGAYGVYLLPGVIFQSVIIGGAYATGREIFEFGGRFGAAGWYSTLAITIGFSVVCMAAFELCRVFRAYDYRNWIKNLIGPLWPIFDVLHICMTILVIAIVAAATGSIFFQVVKIPELLGIVFLILLVGFLNFCGRKVIEVYKTWGTIFLYAGYILFSITVITTRWDSIKTVFATGDTSMVTGSTSAGFVIWTGLLYVYYNIASLPPAFFAIDRQTERKHSLISGLIAGILASIPFGLTYFALMGHYNNAEILTAEVPWLLMLQESAGYWMVIFYAIVVVWTLGETSIGYLHAITDRIDAGLKEAGKEMLTPGQRMIFTSGSLIVSLVLSRIGIIDLVAKGYTMMAYGYLIFFILPLLTIGIIRIINPEWKKEFWSKHTIQTHQTDV